MMDRGTQIGPPSLDYADSKGRFSLTPGINLAVLSVETSLHEMDPGDGVRLPLRLLAQTPGARGRSNCVLHVELPGFRCRICSPRGAPPWSSEFRLRSREP